MRDGRANTWSARARDTIELGFIDLPYPKDVRHLMLDVSQNPTHAKASRECQTIHGTTVLFSYETQSIILTPHVMALHGYPVREEALWQYSDGFLRSVTGDSFYVPVFGCLMMAVFLNKHAPWWPPHRLIAINGFVSL